MHAHGINLQELERDARITPLDPAILSTPFKVETNWHVITGAACSGKTTLIELLAKNGFKTLPEVPRQYIEREVKKGRALDELFSSQDDERAITAMQLSCEGELQAADVVFLDRALPDFLWFWRLMAMDLNEILTTCFQHRYASVFLLDLLPLQLDGARIEDDVYTVVYDLALAYDYAALGYRVQRVPVLPAQDRLTFILERLSELGLI